MLPLTTEFDYVVVDTDEWLEDRYETDDALTEALRAALDEAPWSGVYDEVVTAWIEAQGIAPEATYFASGPIMTGCTINEENFLRDDFCYWLYKTAETGELYAVTMPGYVYNTRVTVRRFTGNDDSEVVDWSSGDAVCSNACGPDWIIESAVTLWPNGGGETYKIGDLLKPVEGGEIGESAAKCPHCKTGDLLFYSR